MLLFDWKMSKSTESALMQSDGYSHDMYDGSEFVLTPQKCHILSLKTVLDSPASFTSSGMKDLCQKWNVKLPVNFRGAYRLPGTGIVECLYIIDVGCNLKQFDGLTWLTLTSYVTTNLRHCVETSVVIKPRALVFSIAVTQDNLPFGWFYNECLYLCWPLSRICRFRFFLGFSVAVSGWTYRSGRRCWV